MYSIKPHFIPLYINKVVFEKGEVYIFNDNQGLVANGKRENLYEIKFEILKSECLNIATNTDFIMWHKRFGHINFNSLEKLIKGNFVKGIDNKISIDKVDSCEPCTLGKMSQLPFGSRTKSNRMFEIVHTDICGPITPPSHDGHRYFVTFIEEFSNFTMTYLIKEKAEVFEKVQEYFFTIKSMFNIQISKLRCDNGGDTTLSNFIKIMA